MHIKKLQGKYWLVAGALAYLGTALSSIIRSLEPMSIVDFLSLSVDWLAACALYFFLGAIVGRLVDWYLDSKTKHPLWLWLTLGLWVLSAILVAIISRPGLLSPGVIVFFPFAFGIFLTGSAFALLFPSFVGTPYGKFVLDIVFLGVFGWWLWLEHKADRRVVLRRALLLTLFAILTVGLIGCARFLA